MPRRSHPVAARTFRQELPVRERSTSGDRTGGSQRDRRPRRALARRNGGALSATCFARLHNNRAGKWRARGKAVRKPTDTRAVLRRVAVGMLLAFLAKGCDTQPDL